MAHGTRGRWLRVVTTGFGVVLCTGLVGCLNNDKSKDTKIGAKQQGLPNTPRIDGPGAGMMAKTGQPTGANGNYQYNGGAQQTGGMQPAPAGAGLGSGQYGQYRDRYGSNGVNTNTGGFAAQQNYGGLPGTPGSGPMVNTPALPGAYNPAGGPSVPASYFGGSGNVTPAGGAGSPPPPSLPLDTVLPPPPPMSGAHGGSDSGAVAPPTGLGPIAPPPPPATGKGPPLGSVYQNP